MSMLREDIHREEMARKSTIRNVIQVYMEKKRDIRCRTMSDTTNNESTDIVGVTKLMGEVKVTSVNSRRNSSSSNDSQSSKKIASLNEIEDLYSALQELVTTNVTTKPLSGKDGRRVSSQTISTVKIDDVQKTSGDLKTSAVATGAISSNETTPPVDCTCAPANQSLKISKSYPIGKNVLEKRSVFHKVATIDNSALNFKESTIRRRISMETPKKISSGAKVSSEPKVIVEAREDDKRNAHPKLDRLFSRGKLLQKLENYKQESGKNFKHKILSRIRSQGSKLKSDFVKGRVDIFSQNPADHRRYSANDCDRQRYPRNNYDNIFNKTTESSTGSSDFTADEYELATNNMSLDEIDSLVEALKLEPKDSTIIDESKKSAESELSKLDSWFEKAAKEAVLHQSRASYYEGDSSPTSKAKTRTINRNRKSALKRNQSLSDDVKKERRTRQILPDDDYVSNNVNSFVRLQARSVPNLRDPDFLENFEDSDTLPDEENSQQDGKIIKKKPDRINRKISFDGSDRLPKAPLFYFPDDNDLKIVGEMNIICNGINIAPAPANKRRISTPVMRHHSSPEWMSQAKQSNNELEKINKLRRRSIFSSEVLFNEAKRKWCSAGEATDDIKNVSILNKVFPKINSNFHISKSLHDMSANSVVHDTIKWADMVQQG